MDKNKSDIKKKAMIEALSKSLGIVSSACKAVNINRNTHYEWLKKDPEYKKAVEDIAEITLDFVESKLYTLIKDGNPNAIFYYLNNKGGSRGYSRNVNELNKLDPKQPLNVTINVPKNFKELPSREEDVEL